MITKNSKVFIVFEKSYWNYYLEMEEQFLSTKRFVAFDKSNFKTYSMEYLKLLQAVCSEIDVMGKEIAHQINPNFKVSDASSNIQKWWYTIQDWYHEESLEPIKMLDEIEFSPWQGYKIEQYQDKNGVTHFRLVKGSKTPHWWTSYNKVKHNRTLDDPDTQEQYFHRANFENLCNAFTALYLLEKRYMTSIGRAEEYNRCQISQLFEKKKPSFFLNESGQWCQAIENDE